MAQSALLKNVSHLSLEPNPVLVAHAKQRAESVQNRIADKITAFSGSMSFVYIHIIWFASWIGFGVEKYPYGLLTMIVSRRSEEHTSELQSRGHIVCRLL